MAGYIGGKAVNLSTSGADISGTANLDVVDIDGTLGVAGLVSPAAGITVVGSTTVDDILLTAVALPGSGTPSIALRNSDNNIYVQTGSGNTLSLLDSSQNTMYSVSPTLQAFSISNSEKMRIDSTGAVTMPAQPAFLAQPASDQNNIALGSPVSVVFGTEIFDQNADFASNTFTAPVTGKYHLDVHLYIESIDTAADYYQVRLITSNRTYYETLDFGGYSADPVYGRLSLSVLADMDASDTSTVAILQVAGTQQTDVIDLSYFSGYLAC